MRTIITPTGREITFGNDELIVSKTDLKGVITYANEVFERVSGFSQAELIGAPHNLIRHPEMPRCVFKLLWDTLKSGNEIFAYVVNLARNGGHYWVFAHVTPSFDEAGVQRGYHSNRRVPYPDALQKVKPLYQALLAEERRVADRHTGMLNAERMVFDLLKKQKQDYSEFVFGLSEQTSLTHSVA